MLWHTESSTLLCTSQAKENGHSLNLDVSLDGMAERSFLQTMYRMLGHEQWRTHTRRQRAFILNIMEPKIYARNIKRLTKTLEQAWT